VPPAARIAVGTHEAAGSTTALSFMVNGMLDFGDDDGSAVSSASWRVTRKWTSDSLRGFENTGEFLSDSDAVRLAGHCRRAPAISDHRT
jgi:hypothetical protein